MRDALGASLLLISSAIFMMALAVFRTPEPGRPAAAIFPPWFDKHEIIGAVSAAESSMLRHGGIETIALVQIDLPESPEKLKQAGAWFVMDYDGLFGCFGLSAERKPTLPERGTAREA